MLQSQHLGASAACTWPRSRPTFPHLSLPFSADLLADLLLAGSRAYTAAPAAAPAAAGTSAAAAHAGWALPQLAPQQQALYQLPASVAPQPHAVQLARVVAAPPASAAHRHGHAAHAVHHAVPQQLHGHAVPYVAVQQVPAQPAPHAPAPAAGQPAAPDVAAFAASFFGDWPASSPKEAEMDALLGGFEPSYDEMRLSLKVRLWKATGHLQRPCGCVANCSCGACGGSSYVGRERIACRTMLPTR